MTVIIILGLVGLIAIPSITRLLGDSKEKLYNKQVEAIVNATRKWGVENDDRILPTKKTYVSIKDLITDGYVEQNSLKDPRNTKEDLNGCVVIEYNEPYDKYEYTYIDEECKSINTSYDLTSADTEYVCYNFDESTGTILNYDKENPNCLKDVFIPRQIDGVDVQYIGSAAFITGATKWCYSGTIYEEVGLEYDCSNDYYYDWEDQISYIKSVEFPESLIGINEWAFADNLISDLNLSDLTNLEYIDRGAFHDNVISYLGLGGLTNLSYIGGEAFENNLISTLIIEDLPNLEDIGWDAFQNNQITTLILDNLINLDYIGESAFAYNLINNLNLDNLPMLEYIAEGAFEDNQITKITIPANILTIEQFAFKGNPFISVKIEGTDIYRFNNVWLPIGFPIALIPTAALPMTLSTVSVNDFSFFNYSYHQASVPTTGSYRLEVWGAEGGGSRLSGNASSGFGGAGGYATGVISLNAGDILYVYVGGQGNSAVSGMATGGWNGGGSGYGSSSSEPGNGGGGATDIRIGGKTLTNRIIVAGGGGGGGEDNGDIYGNGGGTTGVGSSLYNGTETTAGLGGSFGIGGTTNMGDGGGGGGGWYGGGTTSSGIVGTDTQGGGGGSGYVLNASSYKPTGYNPNARFYMTGEQLIAGNATMPNPIGGTMTGNLGNGFARITYLGA